MALRVLQLQALSRDSVKSSKAPIMKNLAFVLLVLGTSAWAEWTRVDRNEDADVYVDLSTIGRQGNIVRMWVLFDYATAQQWSDYLTYWSRKTQKEYDCDREHQRTLDSFLHSTHMASVESNYTVPSGTSWGPVPPDSIDAALWKFACKK